MSTLCRTYVLPSAFCLLTFVAGCTDPGGAVNEPQSPAAVEAQKREVSRRLFDSAVDQLNQLDDYDQIGAEPGVEQVVRRLNESLEAGLLDTDKSEPFDVEDGRILRETVWLRGAARYAVGDATDALVRAERLFDWTVRNIQLIDAAAPTTPGAVDLRLPYLPWHALILGRGSATDRAWLFTLLARQQGLDVVLLAPAEAKPAEANSPLAALVHDGQLYVFDTAWGAPVPGPGGKGIATLAQLQKDDALLRALDLGDGESGGEGPKYPLTAEAAKQLAAYVETSSSFLAPKFARLERLLAGDSRLVLSIDQDELFERVKKCAGVGQVKPWPLRDERFAASREKAAYEALVVMLSPFGKAPGANPRLARSPLWVPRVKHIAGKYADPLTGKATLTRFYQQARPSNEDLKPLGSDSSAWAYAYGIKHNATYWLGLVSYDLGNYETAAEYFNLVLRDEANGGWTAGARYNLGRTFEAMQDTSKAVAAYRATYFGRKPDAACLYRAKRLEKSL
jgi:tetratricopeptide (TPR) repeat protein